MRDRQHDACGWWWHQGCHTSSVRANANAPTGCTIRSATVGDIRDRWRTKYTQQPSHQSTVLLGEANPRNTNTICGMEFWKNNQHYSPTML